MPSACSPVNREQHAKQNKKNENRCHDDFFAKIETKMATVELELQITQQKFDKGL